VVSVFGTEHFGILVTPNVDHVIRHHDDSNFPGAPTIRLHTSCSIAVSLLIRWSGQAQVLRVCLGSDLTTAVLESVLKPLDVAVLVGGKHRQAQLLRGQIWLEGSPPCQFRR